MTDTAAGTRSIVVERDFPHPPEKLWRALTEPHLIAEWLMQTEFRPEVGHAFALRADWGTVDCRVLAVEPPRTLAYTWVSAGLDSVVVWTLTPSATGTLLRMEQSGFAPNQQGAYQGARAGWPRFLGQLEALLARLD